MHAQRKGHARTQGEDGHLQAKERDLRRNKICQHLDLDFQSSDNKFLFLSYLICDILSWQPRPTNMRDNREWLGDGG